MKNTNPIYLLTEGDSKNIVEEITNAIFRKYPTFTDLMDGCETAFMKTDNKVFNKIPEMVKRQMQLVACYHPQLTNDPDAVYYNGIYNFVKNHKQGRVALLTLAGMFGGIGLGAAAGAGLTNDSLGAAIGANVGLFSGLIGSGMAADKGISKKSLRKMYDVYKKDNDVDSMMSKI